MSVHVPSLPSTLAWETPLNLSRDVLGAISDVADSAAETAGQLIRPRRTASRARSLATSALAAVGVAVLVALLITSIVRRSRVEDRAVDDSPHPRRDTGAPPAGDSTD